MSQISIAPSPTFNIDNLDGGWLSDGPGWRWLPIATVDNIEVAILRAEEDAPARWTITVTNEDTGEVVELNDYEARVWSTMVTGELREALKFAAIVFPQVVPPAERSSVKAA